MDNEVQKSHSCSSSTCNGWRNQNCDVVFRGGRVSTIDGVSPLCLHGEKTMVRTARTAKNIGKQFWSCPKYKTVRSGRPPSCITLPTTSVLKTIRSGRPPSSTARPTTFVLKIVWSGRPPSCIALPTTSVVKTVRCGHPPSCIAFPTTSVFKTVRSGRPPSCIALPTTSVLQTVRSGRPPSCIALPSTSMFPTVRSGRPPSSVRSPSLSLPHLLLLYTFQPLTCAPCLPTFDLYDRYRSASLLYKTSKKEILIYPKYCNTSKTVPGH
ncbi:hypothetical protein LR48_Vigan588s002900 [Vigna angularis]|uniref:GRF-type domain-containing protein n=1 Tax=Phaseolus angularis TaxID=3914 RepID=A0A0L9TEK3_PHAAN|nr:hypothetical protein LR48_Vigan588s002900 [Vigna angularis]